MCLQLKRGEDKFFSEGKVLLLKDTILVCLRGGAGAGELDELQESSKVTKC